MSLANNRKLRIAVQKSGRLSDKSFRLLEQCGIEIDRKKDRLLVPCQNFPVEFMLVRDDDIPEYVNDGVCDLGIVGQNVIMEKLPEDSLQELRSLGFGYCRLAIAISDKSSIEVLSDLNSKRLATSYPKTLGRFLSKNDIVAKIISIAGSVEIAPSLNIADGICDLVSTGGTLRANGLRELSTVSESQAVLVTGKQEKSAEKLEIMDLLLQRMDGVIKAQRTKYVMMNAPVECLDEIKRILPGMEEPTIVPLTTPGKVAIHAVAHENIFWETMERLKQVGASSILVVPIEKIID